MNFDPKNCDKCGGYMHYQCLDCGTATEDQIYATCCKLVITTQNASTSYVQRQLRIGYNLAAKFVDRMEKENLVSRPNHIGRRSVLVQEAPAVHS